MFVLGIDPGLTRCGYGLVRGIPGRRPEALAAGVLTTPASDPVPARLAALAGDLRNLLAEFAPEVVALERVVFQAAVRNAIPVAQSAGVAMALAHERGSAVVEYAANEVKSAVTGSGSASKEQVQQMVQVQLKLAARPDPPDAADALAIALCHLARAPLARAVG